MKIDLGGGYFLMSDEYQFIVGIPPAKGKEKRGIRDPAYFATIPAALKYLYEKKLGAMDISTVQELLDAINGMRGDIDSLRLGEITSGRGRQ